MNIQQLEYIVALDKFKSFSKAAEACYITQATLSTMVKKLEEELDIMIFDRKTNPILITDEGKEILQEAKKVLFHSQNLKRIASDSKGKIEGDLKLGVIPTIAGNLLYRVVPITLEKYPLLKLSIVELPTEQLLQKLKSGEIDAGILSTPLTTTDMEEEVLYYEQLMVYGKLKNATTKYLTPKDISNENVWLLEQGNCLSSQIKNVCALNPKKINSNLKYHPNSFDSLINMVDNYHGLTVIPELYYKDLSAEKKKNVNNFKPPFPVREVSLVYHRPFAKLRLIEAVSKEIKSIITPLLKTGKWNKKEMMIAKM